MLRLPRIAPKKVITTLRTDRRREGTCTWSLDELTESMGVHWGGAIVLTGCSQEQSSSAEAKGAVGSGMLQSFLPSALCSLELLHIDPIQPEIRVEGAWMMELWGQDRVRWRMNLGKGKGEWSAQSPSILRLNANLYCIVFSWMKIIFPEIFSR